MLIVPIYDSYGYKITIKSKFELATKVAEGYYNYTFAIPQPAAFHHEKNYPTSPIQCGYYVYGSDPYGTYLISINDQILSVELPHGPNEEYGNTKIYTLQGTLFADFYDYKIPENIPSGLYLMTFENSKGIRKGKLLIR